MTPALLALLLVASPDAGAPPARSDVPVLLVHGMFNQGQDMAALRDHLLAHGCASVEAMTLSPVGGSAPVEVLAQQLEAEVEALRTRTHAERIDLVGHSLGAMVIRYWLQRMHGAARARRYVSLSGPHQGVVGAWASHLPLAKQLRPGSAFLRDLEKDADPFPGVEAFDFYTPLDAIVVPAERQKLPGACVRRACAVPSHARMHTDPAMLTRIRDALVVGPAAFPPEPGLGQRLKHAVEKRPAP